MNTTLPQLRMGMVGLGMIFSETYLPLLEELHARPLMVPGVGPVRIVLSAVASRTGNRFAELRNRCPQVFADTKAFAGPDAGEQLAREPLDFVCVATPDPNHFEASHAALQTSKHLLIEKPSVLNLDHFDALLAAARAQRRLAKVVYHKLLDPDHKRLRTLVHDRVLKHVNNGFCSLLEPKSISQTQFSSWIHGRNPATYVAVHYLKLIDFTFFQDGQAQPSWIRAAGQRGQIASPSATTWDSVQLQVNYRYPDERDATFDLHASWVNPDSFPGYVEQEVQFRFDNGVWNASQRRRGVEVCVEAQSAEHFKTTPNHHYNADVLEPWGIRHYRGYGLEAIQRFFEEVAYLEFGGAPADFESRWQRLCSLSYNDLSADRSTVAMVQACERILSSHAAGKPGGLVTVNGAHGGLVIAWPGQSEFEVMYSQRV